MNKLLLSRILTVTAVAFLIAVFFAPTWWVSLKAPNYPPESFPEGVRIHFHMNGVFNGCPLRQSEELHIDEALDCVHEMNTINHYVGMYPIASAAPVERAFSPMLVSLLILMLLVFMMPGKKSQFIILGIGAATISTWLLVALFTEGGIMFTSDGYRQALMTSMDLDADEIKGWSLHFAMLEGYRDSLGAYFRNPVEIEPRVAMLSQAAYVIAAALIVAMLVLIIGLWKMRNFFYWLLIIIPILLPVFFILDYAAWLWWYGHTLNDMAAFSIKPFMPTVFGDGKVAQFSTHSYPHYGFALMLASSFSLGLAALLRRKQLREEAS
ncbi:hypothetical protein [Candidatus Venteria ishoeyi]|uniref:Uncharacterized protein n=1 Tax=Candidatus Venteria ishoeyi TaxID=1899563 RepID=A0A1H6FIY9_9GAMM|nr:hypothetical protein [Candidatus Venteria ishoeyi]MDM8547894.1 hypothetical protein [Candidatus Venteria ishoeyi]SEH08984.1 Uncharacterised protein [Candidatus Venteria ishoeyi]